MHLRFFLHVIFINLIFALPYSVCHAVSWYDSFDDGSIVDGSPFSWDFNLLSATPGSYDASSGDLELSAPGDPMPSIPTDPADNTMAASVDISFTDTYARTQAIVIPDDPLTEGRGNVGILTRWNPNTLSGYVTLMDHGDELEIFRIDNGIPSPLLIQSNVGVNALTDAIMEVEMIGSQLSVYLWSAQDTKPASPINTIIDSTYPTGRVGLFFNEDSDGHTGIFRYANAQDTPILPGDFDSDQDVDDVDLAQFSSSYGLNGLGDANFDGNTNGKDYLEWARNFGTDLSFVATVQIPEPISSSLILVAAMIGGRRNRNCGMLNH